MKLTLHHINLTSENVDRMNIFYRDIIGLGEQSEDLPTLEKKKGYDGDVAFRGDGAIQFHLAKKDQNVNFKTGHAVNPVERGHIAFRTDDLEAFKKHLEANNIPYSDWGNLAVQGWHQIFFYDPEGNVIEVHQVAE